MINSDKPYSGELRIKLKNFDIYRSAWIIRTQILWKTEIKTH